MRWFRTLPLWSLAGALFVVTGTLWSLSMMVLRPGLPVPAFVSGGVFFGALMAAVFVLWIHQARRRAGGAEALDQMRAPLRAGTVPVDADLPTWTATVENLHRLQRRSIWMAPVVLGALILLSGWLAVTQSPWWLVAIALWAVVLVTSVIRTPRTVRKTERMRDELRTRALAPAPHTPDVDAAPPPQA